MEQVKSNGYSIGQTEDIILRLKSSLDRQRVEIEGLEKKLNRYRSFTKKLQDFIECLCESIERKNDKQDCYVESNEVLRDFDIGRNIEAMRRFLLDYDSTRRYLKILGDIELTFKHKDQRIKDLEISLKAKHIQIPSIIPTETQMTKDINKEIKEISETSQVDHDDDLRFKFRELYKENKYLKEIISKCSGHIQALNFN